MGNSVIECYWVESGRFKTQNTFKNIERQNARNRGTASG